MKLQSPIPECCKTEPCWLGVDEAGRGPVLGPMVYATFFSPLSQKKRLEKCGFDDSKVLSEKDRESLLEDINKATDDFVAWNLHVLTPQDISGMYVHMYVYKDVRVRV